MKNKKGGFGAKFLLVLILMIASAVGGAYGYSILDGKLASRDALKAVENVDISDYDTPEQTVIQGYIDEAKKNLETCKTRKEVYEVISDFIEDVSKVQTANEKKLEEALKAAEEAKQQQYNNNNNNSSSNNSSSGLFDPSQNQSQDQNQNQSQSQDQSTYTNDTTDNAYNSDDTGTVDDAADQEEDDGGGFLGSLLGGMSSGANGN